MRSFNDSGCLAFLFLNGKGTLNFAFAFAFEGGERVVGEAPALPSSTSPSSGDEVCCRFGGLPSGVLGLGRFDGEGIFKRTCGSARCSATESATNFGMIL